MNRLLRVDLLFCCVCCLLTFTLVCLNPVGAQEAAPDPTSTTDSQATEGSAAAAPADEESSGEESPDVRPDSAAEASAGGDRSGEKAELSQVDPAGPDGEISEADYQAEFKRRVRAFREARDELEKAVGDQREIYIRYLNREEDTPDRRDAFIAKRDQVRQLLDKAFAAALDTQRIGFDEEGATFLATMILHRFERDIYNLETLEAAALLIDGGSNLRYLFQAAARSAVVSGEFKMAAQLYEAMKDESQEDVDSRLEFNLEQYREQFEADAATREANENDSNQLPQVLLKTTQGDVVVELYMNEAPSTVANFIRLVDDGFYDGLDFYQVIDHLLALTGDPTGAGAGNSGKYILDEHNRPNARKGMRGSLVMAKLPMGGEELGSFIPNSASSQFAILFLPVLSVSEQQTIFGRVIKGMDAVCRFRRVDPSKEKAKGEIQYPPDSIIEATVIRRPENMAEPQYYRQ